ncbi:MAG: tRNA (adenosine(37)-N6)-dimethylallyltransferase MiaA [Bacteroidia bacterium]
MRKPLVIVVTGPTGSGKTAFSIRLAKKLNCSIISADSRQVFKEIPIGSAAPTNEELNEVKHYLVGSHSINDKFNAGVFEKEALKILESLFKENNIQLVCGGTGLYIKALLEGLDNIPDSSDEIRTELDEIWESDPEVLKKQLQELDPEYSKITDLSNKQRVIRALEVIQLSGKTYSSFRKSSQKARDFDYVILAMELPREELYQRINRRSELMIEAGWIKEARNVFPFREVNALQTVGFRELFEFFDGRLSQEEAIEKIKINTRRYAKRQLTWIRNQQEVSWVNPEIETESVIKIIKDRFSLDELS